MTRKVKAASSATMIRVYLNADELVFMGDLAQAKKMLKAEIYTAVLREGIKVVKEKRGI